MLSRHVGMRETNSEVSASTAWLTRLAALAFRCFCRIVRRHRPVSRHASTLSRKQIAESQSRLLESFCRLFESPSQ